MLISFNFWEDRQHPFWCALELIVSVSSEGFSLDMQVLGYEYSVWYDLNGPNKPKLYYAFTWHNRGVS